MTDWQLFMNTSIDYSKRLFNGSISKVCVYNRVLASEEVQRRYNQCVDYISGKATGESAVGVVIRLLNRFKAIFINKIMNVIKKIQS